jgi:hypothetical protein
MFSIKKKEVSDNNYMPRYQNMQGSSQLEQFSWKIKLKMNCVVREVIKIQYQDVKPIVYQTSILKLHQPDKHSYKITDL